MQPGLTGFLGIGFGLGLVHALDADHILAVSTLAMRERPGRVPWRYCAQWAMGHGGTLLLIGALVLLAGYGIPAQLSSVAERAAGVVMMALGAWAVVDMRRRKLHLHSHRHPGMPTHEHWYAHDPMQAAHDRYGHGATLVGALHGVAGSTPLLVLLPLTQSGSPWHGLFYLATFSAGVLSAMLAFGGVLGGFLRRSDARAAVWVPRLRIAIAAGAMLAGVHALWSGG